MAAIYSDGSCLSKACAAGDAVKAATFNTVLLDVRGEGPEHPRRKIRRLAERPQAIRNQRNIRETGEAKRPGHEVPGKRDGLRFPSSTLAIPPAPKSKEKAHDQVSSRCHRRGLCRPGRDRSGRLRHQSLLLRSKENAMLKSALVAAAAAAAALAAIVPPAYAIIPCF